MRGGVRGKEGRETLGMMEGFISASARTRGLSQSVTPRSPSTAATTLDKAANRNESEDAHLRTHTDAETCRHMHIFPDNEDKGEHKDVSGFDLIGSDLKMCAHTRAHTKFD